MDTMHQEQDDIPLLNATTVYGAPNRRSSVAALALSFASAERSNDMQCSVVNPGLRQDSATIHRMSHYRT